MRERAGKSVSGVGFWLRDWVRVSAIGGNVALAEAPPAIEVSAPAFCELSPKVADSSRENIEMPFFAIALDLEKALAR